MRIWIKDVDFNKVWYSTELITDENVDRFTIHANDVSALHQSHANDRITLYDSQFRPVVTIDSDAFSTMEVM